VRALHPPDLDAAPGRFVGLLGPNGFDGHADLLLTNWSLALLRSGRRLKG
jgi:ABC-type hemin transport system ATPase subunit